MAEMHTAKATTATLIIRPMTALQRGGLIRPNSEKHRPAIQSSQPNQGTQPYSAPSSDTTRPQVA